MNKQNKISYNTAKNSFYRSKQHKKYNNNLDDIFEKSITSPYIKEDNITNKIEISKNLEDNQNKFPENSDNFPNTNPDLNNQYEDTQDYFSYDNQGHKVKQKNNYKNNENNFFLNNDFYNQSKLNSGKNIVPKNEKIQNKFDNKLNPTEPNPYSNEGYKTQNPNIINTKKYDSYYYDNKNNYMYDKNNQITHYDPQNQTDFNNPSDNYYNNQTYSSTTKYKSNPEKKERALNSKKHANSYHQIKNNAEKISNQKEKMEKYFQNLKNKTPELTYNLINELIESEYECMICNDQINQTEETWSCDKCFTLYHIKCIYDWIFKLNSENDQQKKKKISQAYKWTCPHCNCNYSAVADNLPKYNCFCKRYYKAEEGYKNNVLEYKDFNPQLIPHGCGLICNMKICKHLICDLPCHPGPHLQCVEIETLNCFCGNSKKDLQCSLLTNPENHKNNSLIIGSLKITNNKFTCEKICEKILNCKRHTCKELCHEGDCEGLFRYKKCPECILEAKEKFMNFLNNLENKIRIDFKKDVKLAEDLAEYIFHGLLLCKTHYTEINTDENLRFLLKLIQISGNSLIENIKKFIPICKAIVLNSCQCKAKSYKTECYKINYKEDMLNFLELNEQKEKVLNSCNKICKALKSCKIHTCDRVCCELANIKITNYSRDDPFGLHLCLLQCGKILNCGLHTCENYCHRGNCLPCKNIIREGESFCSCGNTKISAPFQCGLKPICKLPCLKPRECPHHCKLECHEGECPECEELVIKECECKKIAIENIKCGNKNPPRCNTTCDEMLPCGAHFCDLICHEHTEEYDKNYFCNLACGRQFKYCKHTCKKRCHGESDCYELECDIKLKIFCKCKVNSKDYRCGEVKKLSNNFSEEFFILCNDECKRIERLKKIEIAFDGLFKYNQERNKQLLKGMGIIEKKANSEGNNPTSNIITRNLTNDTNNIQIKQDECEHEEFTKRICDVKFSYRNINYAFDKIKFIIELENTSEKALRNLTVKHEINQLDKKEYIFASEFLKSYYNIEVEKIKRGTDLFYNILLKNCHEGKIPRIKLSLLALLLKDHKFVRIQKKENTPIPKKCIIYHPFEMSIYIQDYRLHVTPEMIDAFVSTIVNSERFYVDEIKKGQCYIHFFDKYSCKKVYNDLKSKPSQFQDCYQISYYHEDNWKYEDLYLYLKNEEYYNMLKEVDEHNKDFVVVQGKGPNKEAFVMNKKDEGIIKEEEKENEKGLLIDSGVRIEDNYNEDDGFVVITKKKKK